MTSQLSKIPDAATTTIDIRTDGVDDMSGHNNSLPAGQRPSLYNNDHWLASDSTRWEFQSQFVPLRDAEVFELTLERIRTLRQSRPTEKAIVVVDLDDTAYDSRYRTIEVLREWAQSQSGQKHPEVAKKIIELPPERATWGVAETLLKAGVRLSRESPLLKEMVSFFLNRFFDHDLTVIDSKHAGAFEFLQTIEEAGGTVVFLTGRLQSQQGQATMMALERDGMAIDGQTRFLFTKPYLNESDGTKYTDEEYKSDAAKEIDALGTVVATYDNEPANVEVYSRIFPSAQNVWVATRDSGKRPKGPTHGLYRVKNFREFLSLGCASN